MKTNELYRPDFHYTAKSGWINDPNGFSVYNGKYHLFAQHNPNDTKWGPMHWSHAVSEDLISWEHLPIALTPTEDYEHDMGCFSGTAMEHNGKHVLMYTGCNGKIGGASCQTQCIAVGDGELYKKSANNPVISEKQLPEMVSANDFRDPKLFKVGDWFYALMGSRLKDREIGSMLLYRSPDLEKWEYVGEALRGAEDGSMGTVFECPDIFKLGDKYVILTSPINMPPQGDKYRNVSSAVYFVGDIDLETGKFTAEYYDEIDGGFDFYAPQTTESLDAERVMIAWAQMWDRVFITDELGHGWTGCMTLPRVLSLKNKRLYQQPVKGLEKYHGERYCDITKGNTDSYRIKVSADLTSGDSICLNLLKTDSGCVKIIYDKASNTLSLDRSATLYRLDKNPREENVKNVRRVKLSSDVKLTLDIIVDNSIVEVFINEGEQVMTSNYYKGEGDVTNEIITNLKHEIEKFDITI